MPKKIVAYMYISLLYKALLQATFSNLIGYHTPHHPQLSSEWSSIC